MEQFKTPKHKQVKIERINLYTEYFNEKFLYILNEHNIFEKYEHEFIVDSFKTFKDKFNSIKDYDTFLVIKNLQDENILKEFITYKNIEFGFGDILDIYKKIEIIDINCKDKEDNYFIKIEDKYTIVGMEVGLHEQDQLRNEAEINYLNEYFKKQDYQIKSQVQETSLIIKTHESCS